MSQLLERMEEDRNQSAVYWASLGPDGRGGFSYDSPVDVSCRWEDRQETFIDVNGQECLSHAVIYPDQELARDGMVVKGYTVATLPSDITNNPQDMAAARLIRQVGNSPTLDGTDQLDKAWL